MFLRRFSGFGETRVQLAAGGHEPGTRAAATVHYIPSASQSLKYMRLFRPADQSSFWRIPAALWGAMPARFVTRVMPVGKSSGNWRAGMATAWASREAALGRGTWCRLRAALAAVTPTGVCRVRSVCGTGCGAHNAQFCSSDSRECRSCRWGGIFRDHCWRGCPIRKTAVARRGAVLPLSAHAGGI